MLYGYTCLNMKSFYSILASFIFWPEDTSPNFTNSIYCQIQHTSNSSVTYAYVNARGGYSENPTSAWAFCNSAEPSNRYMSVGTQYFIYNSVKENGYTWAALSFKTPKAVTMRGEWSPDSVPQSGVVQI